MDKQVMTTPASRRLPRQNWRLGAVALAALVVSGCAVLPEPLTPQQQADSVQADKQRMFEQTQVLTEPVSLDAAVARSLKYNLDHRLAMMEGILRERQLDVSRFDMLPKLAANAGWVTRSNEYLTLSKGTVLPTQSQDITRRTADLGLTWNVLDFGVSYYQAKQNADQLLISQERKRKIVNQIVQQVRSAYWRAATAELLQGQVVVLLGESRKALNDARAVEQGRLAPPIEMLQYQKSLVQLIKELEQLERDLIIAKTELRSLMGLAPGSELKVALPTASELTPPRLTLGLEQMEDEALLHRPELREERYQKRIAALETRKALLRLLPGVSFNTGLNYDSNSYLVNEKWSETGMRVTWNLFNTLSGPKVMAAAEAQVEVGEWRRMALSMAVLTQVHVGYQQYLRASHNYKEAKELNQIEQRIYGHVRNAAQHKAQSPLQGIRARLSALYADVGRYYAYAEMQGAVANLHVTLGKDLLPVDMLSQDVPTIQAAVKKTFQSWYPVADSAELELPVATVPEPAESVPVAPVAVTAAKAPKAPDAAAVRPLAEGVDNGMLARIWADAFNAASRIDFKNPFAEARPLPGEAAMPAGYADKVVKMIRSRFFSQDAAKVTDGSGEKGRP